MKIYVGGTNAVGKSTLLKATAERIGYQYVHATSELLDFLGFGKDYEKLRALTQAQRDSACRECIEKLLKNGADDFLLDAHYLGLVRGKVDRVTDSWLKDFDRFVLVSAPLDDVWERIKSDLKFRDRALFPKEIPEVQMKDMLAKYQEQTLAEYKRITECYKKPHIEIFNEENRLEASVQQLVFFIEN